MYLIVIILFFLKRLRNEKIQEQDFKNLFTLKFIIGLI